MTKFIDEQGYGVELLPGLGGSEYDGTGDFKWPELRIVKGYSERSDGAGVYLRPDHARELGYALLAATLGVGEDVAP